MVERSSWCPQCGTSLTAPSAPDSAWRCFRHGAVLPLTVFDRANQTVIDHVRHHAEVPLWLPDPLPRGWTLSGLAAVRDAARRIRGTVSAFRGPAPLGGDGEWLIVAEEPGIGLGAAYARSPALTLPPPTSTPPVKIHALGHPAPLWAILDCGPDRSAYVGEADGVWLWLISFPADAGYAVLEDLALVDARDGIPPVVPTSGLSERLRPNR